LVEAEGLPIPCFRGLPAPRWRLSPGHRHYEFNPLYNVVRFFSSKSPPPNSFVRFWFFFVFLSHIYFFWVATFFSRTPPPFVTGLLCFCYTDSSQYPVLVVPKFANFFFLALELQTVPLGFLRIFPPRSPGLFSSLPFLCRKGVPIFCHLFLVGS